MADISGDADGRRRSLGPLKRLYPYIFRYRTMVVGALISLAVAAGTTLALPMAVRRMIDNGFSSSGSTFIAEYFAALVAMAALLAAASAGRYYFVITLGERVVADIRRDVFAHVTTLSPAFFDKAHSGEIVSRLAADTTQVKSAVGATASVALRNVILGLGAVAMMVFTSPKLSGLVIAAIPLIVLPLVAFGRSVRRKSRQAQDTLANATAYASEQIGAVRTLQAFTNETLVTGRFSAAVEAAFEAARGSVLARAFLTFFAIFMIFSSVVAVLWFGSRDVLSGTMSAGTLGQFLLYSVFAAGALGALSEVWGELAQAAGAAERLTEILAEKPAIQPPADPRPLPAKAKGAISFDDVSFSYPARPDRAAVHGLSFQVKPGETVAIVGPSGAGKSTVFSLILRFYDPETGRIVIDGVDLREADPAAIRQRIAIVPQDVTIFAASARDNIGFGRPGASDAEIEAAAKAALADEFILKLDKGYDSQVGERGVTLSGGQRQRVAIARAILRDAPILLLDEATSALDAESETLVQTALERLMQGRTTIVIAHRLATVLKADRILVMEGGRIVEEGTHQSLVAKGGIYARLAKLQFETGASAFRGAAE
ncbi:ATP-binding cassette domain-containing protein [Mesorhizobium sp. M4B.F.Ca.ET.215.01.1.1]|uniref:ABC transporter transmembrane domain-containing protein n=6 Tax=Mesorhizobium TaxID=68287 RepID=UPI0010929158|nr:MULTISPECIES: ABC transporter transmembrane domain-containing protein [unclassified Mesorhizobium]TGQ07043.1 ATP-binding cassette domain-containing protein [Mesorhizobium sp. M4B.F.Ca.ET.215.01.1.1]TGQ27898.1 ATP-binding cassette domain-containing protein [Mesorhizobium sp. M4B.F.Ca.ET.214.01.1.1]TGQ34723.1 ATP-binding cassette domain-containing protein [Mesorhizobium sp. M00.F.Ca.ET.220.01.1.1]TGQ54976.1 ATP-binding cassette domain-containing protein [Mesorhizobium sp. M4B.F.Ca.ET.211.01.1.